MADQFMFHIRNAPPGDLAAVLVALENYPKLSTVAEVVEQAENLGFSIQDRRRFESLITARDLGLVHQDKNTLTSKGLDFEQPDIV